MTRWALTTPRILRITPVTPNSALLTAPEPHPINWTPRPNAFACSRKKDGDCRPTHFHERRTCSSPLESGFFLVLIGQR